jgi:hypothetical protein|tara:strand:- start:20977 stop:22050 length:1074 start_codon:yes stop_codon:yes gene_type:complete
MPKSKSNKKKQVTLGKWLYKFEVNKTSLEKVTTTSKDKDGNEVSVTKEEEVTKPLECYILRPRRSLIDQAELFYGVQLAVGVKAGLLTKSLINKRYSEDGGVFSKKDQEVYANLQLTLLRKEKELQKLELADVDQEEKKERDKRASEVLFGMTEIRQQMQDFEAFREAIFDQTADTRAKNKIVLWWILNLSYIKDELEGGETVPLFKGETYEEKLNCYDNYEELSIEHVNQAMGQFAYYISFWHNGQANTKEDFDRVKVFLDLDLNDYSGKKAEDRASEAERKVIEAEDSLKDIEKAEKAEENVLEKKVEEGSPEEVEVVKETEETEEAKETEETKETEEAKETPEKLESSEDNEVK